MVSTVRELCGGVDFALESTGRENVLAQGVEMLDARGTIGVVGAPPQSMLAGFDGNNLILGGRSIRGIIEGDGVAARTITDLLAPYRQGRFPFDRLIRFYPFEQINQAAADSSREATIKPVLRMPD